VAGGPGALTLRRAAALALLLLLPSASEAGPGPLTAPPSTYRPVVVDGFTFPVARTSWLSVIEFDDDWHAPRMRLIGGRWQQVGVHEGLDITAEPGTPVLSMSAGRVEALGWTFYSGNRVGVRGDDGRYYFYAHLSSFADLGVGSRVGPGTPLGRVGNTGYGPPGHTDEFPPHLHVGIRAADWVSPYPLVSRLYRRAVRATSRGEARLTALARRGDRVGFERLAARLYADLRP